MSGRFTSFFRTNSVLFAGATAIFIYFSLLLGLTQPPPGIKMAHQFLLIYSALLALMGLGSFNKKALAEVLLVGLYLHFLWIAVLSGGVHSVSLAWFIILPSATLLLGFRSTVFWGSCSVISMLGLGWSQSRGWIDSAMLSSNYAYWVLGMQLGMMLAGVLVVLVYEKLNNDHMEQLLEQKEVLIDVQNQLMRTQAHKDEFIAVVSHELRTPMNAILGFTSLLGESVAHALRSKILYIQQSAKQLLAVISDILNFSQLQAGKLKLAHEEINPLLLIEQAIMRAKDDAEAKNLKV